MNLNRLRSIVALLIAAQGLAAKADVTLAWNPVPGAAITNYTLLWGTNSGVYIFEAYTGTQTSLTVTSLSPNTVYYFAVTATAQDGTQSLDSGEICFTNAPEILSTGPPGTGGGIGFTSEVSVPGVPPVLTLSFTNHHPLLAISGTLASTLMIQSTTNPANLNSWTTITNLTMTNPAAAAPTNQGSPSAINLAFVPAAQNYEVIDRTPPTCEFYQVVMPYDYMVLADYVLARQGYTNRLLLVRMPGISSDDVCYVTNQNSFLFYDGANRAFALAPAGSTIRQIATALSTSLGQNWTSASEFTYSNGVTTILATVVETEPASSDPVACAATPSIQIDF